MICMKGTFVIIEGISGVGKTTTVKEATHILDKPDTDIVYSKGFVKDSLWQYIINTYPHSGTYYLDLAVQTALRITPQLRKGKTVVQDRYVQTIDSFFPDCEWTHNRLFRKMLDPLFLKPDVYVHVTADIGEVTQRLSKFVEDDYRSSLVLHPERQVRREAKYREIFAELTCPKYVLDTSGKKPRDCAHELIDILRGERLC
ncbi:MAG: hypothetical protein V1725_05605 [archaeon]